MDSGISKYIGAMLVRTILYVGVVAFLAGGILVYVVMK